MKYFPTEAGSRVALMKLLDRMVSTPEQLVWLVNTLVDRIGTYAGPDQIRAVFCTKFRPKDSIESALSLDSPIYRSEEQLVEDHKLLEGARRDQDFERFMLQAGYDGQRLIAGEVEAELVADKIIDTLLVSTAMEPVEADAVPGELEALVLHARAEVVRERRIRRTQAEADIANGARSWRSPEENAAIRRDLEQRLSQLQAGKRT